MTIVLRAAQPEDAEACGLICYEAFRTISNQHNFPPDFPEAGMAVGLMSFLFSRDDVYAIVAEQNGRIAGSNCLWKGDIIAGVGPITVDPGVQNAAVGKHLMQAVLRHAEDDGFPGVRLVQAAYHNRSLSLYTKLGFDAREPLSVMQGPAIKRDIPSHAVRTALEPDLDACNRLCAAIHGHDRGGELLDAIKQRNAAVVEHNGRITGYATALGFFGHAVGESNDDLKALIGAADSFAGPGFMVPTRNSELMRWCLQRGLRVVQPMTLMSIGLYNEPKGAFLPSILY